MIYFAEPCTIFNPIGNVSLGRLVQMSSTQIVCQVVQRFDAFFKNGKLNFHFYHLRFKEKSMSLIHYISSHFTSLPGEIAEIQLNKRALRRKIMLAIENLYGIDSMVYAPFKAFEAIVREQILLLKKPVLACVELVIEELSKAVRACTRKVSAINLLNGISSYFTL